jgi:crotonobetainyl-CoA:carnitine CoA-transferase CaiB-like acyl-CoA transferase
MSMAGEPDSPPTKAGISYVDHSGGLAAALGICAALVERNRTGVGTHVDLSLFDVQISMLTYLASWQRNAGAALPRMASSAHPSLVPAQNFRTSDGYLALFVGNDQMWVRFTAALGDDDSLRDVRFASRQGRLEHRDDVVERVAAILAREPAREWERRLAQHGVACAVVNDVSDALDEPQTKARGLVGRTTHPAYGAYQHVRGPLPTLGTSSLRPAPLLGEHTADALAGLGYSDARIAQLARAGVVTTVVGAPTSSADPNWRAGGIDPQR